MTAKGIKSKPKAEQADHTGYFSCKTSTAILIQQSTDTPQEIAQRLKVDMELVKLLRGIA